MDYQRLLELTEKVLIVREGHGPSRKGGITRTRVIPEGGSSFLELKNWEDSTPAQRKARDAINNAIKSGALEKASTRICFRCRKRPGAEYHHINGYHEGKKLQVRAICVKCHSAITKKSDAAMPENNVLKTKDQPMSNQTLSQRNAPSPLIARLKFKTGIDLLRNPIERSNKGPTT